MVFQRLGFYLAMFFNLTRAMDDRQARRMARCLSWNRPRTLSRLCPFSLPIRQKFASSELPFVDAPS